MDDFEGVVLDYLRADRALSSTASAVSGSQ